MGKIFINYRRNDDAGFAQALYQRLEDEFGVARLFMDVGHIEPGEDFVEALRTYLAQCDVLLVIIGPRWAGLLVQRADDSDDFVVMEIKAALKQNKRVIPVLVGGASFPRAEILPETIRTLARIEAFDLRPDHFKTDCQGLCVLLKKVLDEAARAQAERGDIIYNLVKSQESLEAALRVGRLYADVKLEVVRRVLQGTVDLVKAWAEQRGNEGWEVITDWKKGSWITSPNSRFLPIMLRKKDWPMMGVIVMAGGYGPREIEIAVMAPSRATWEEAGDSVEYYGDWSAFVDDDTRSRVGELKEEFPELNKHSPWEPLYGFLHFEGMDISDLREDEAVLFVNHSMTRLVERLGEQMIELAKKLSEIQIKSA
jgi:hypothetical protein